MMIIASSDEEIYNSDDRTLLLAQNVDQNQLPYDDYSISLREIHNNCPDSDNDTQNAILDTLAKEDIQRSSDDSSLKPVLILSCSFMVMFTGFNTCGVILPVVIDSIKKDDPSFHASGYISLAVIYSTFSVIIWFVPSIISSLGPKLTMIIGSVTYVLYIYGFLWPNTWLLYFSSMLVGAGAALLWTAQGNYITLVSDSEMMSRNSAIFLAMMHASLFFGNLFVFYQFQGQTIIGSHTRLMVFNVLGIVSAIGTVIMIFLPKPGSKGTTGRADKSTTLYIALRDSFALFRTKEMLLLSLTAMFIGIEMSFYSSVYSTCLGFTLRFDDPKRLVGLSGVLIGFGEMVGGGVFVILGKNTNKFGRDPIVLFGYLLHLITCFLIFLNLPFDSPLGDTSDPVFLPNGQPNKHLALFCSFLLGFGDLCFSMQVYSILGSVYADQSGPAFAAFRFTSSLSAAACGFYASVLQLHWHLLILVIFGTAGTFGFCVVEWEARIKQKKQPDTVAFDLFY